MVDESKKSKSALVEGGKILGEVVFTPGTSLLLDGNVKSGLGHVVSGLVARSILGLPGMLLVAANSYVTSSTGKSLLGNVSKKSN